MIIQLHSKLKKKFDQFPLPASHFSFSVSFDGLATGFWKAGRKNESLQKQSNSYLLYKFDLFPFRSTLLLLLLLFQSSSSKKSITSRYSMDDSERQNFYFYNLLHIKLQIKKWTFFSLHHKLMDFLSDKRSLLMSYLLQSCKKRESDSVFPWRLNEHCFSSSHFDIFSPGGNRKAGGV